MSDVKKTRRFRSQEEIETLLRQYQDSGKRTGEFCRSQGISPSTFSKWLTGRKSRKKKNGFDKLTGHRGTNPALSFIPLSVEEKIFPQPFLSICLSEGRRIEFYHLPEPAYLKALVE